jgi:nucleoside-diphosphate-sugar epimerase
MRLDLTVNLFTIQALTKGVITVHGGQQWRPSIHIDDMTDLYVWMVDHPEVHGVFNAGFENHSLMEIANKVRRATDAVVIVTDEKDKRSYQVNSTKLLDAGFVPKKTIRDAIFELKDAYQQGKLEDRPEHYNLSWLQHLGVRDE